MSAAPPRKRHTEPITRRGAAAFDVEKVHGPFRAEIAQLAHAIRRLLDSNGRAVARPDHPSPPRPPALTCISGDFERVM